MAAPTHVLATRTVADTNTDIDRDPNDEGKEFLG